MDENKKDWNWFSRETLKHIMNVRTLITCFALALDARGQKHDKCKLSEPEASIFKEFTPKLKDLSYGSDEYKACLKDMKVAIDHHYANSSHHPEHFENGLKGMNLLDLVEMFCDWKASAFRHVNGDLAKSIDINTTRFNMSDDLKAIFMNTVEFMNEKDPILKRGE